MTFYVGLMDMAADGRWGVTFPDLPGCTSAGNDPDDLFRKSIEAVRLWVEDAIGDGETVPKSRTPTQLLADSDVQDTIREVGPTSFIQVPLLLDSGRSVRANISLDAGLLEAIDAAAGQMKLTRSAFLASAAREKITRSA